MTRCHMQGDGFVPYWAGEAFSARRVARGLGADAFCEARLGAILALQAAGCKLRTAKCRMCGGAHLARVSDGEDDGGYEGEEGSCSASWLWPTCSSGAQGPARSCSLASLISRGCASRSACVRARRLTRRARLSASWRSVCSSASRRSRSARCASCSIWVAPIGSMRC